MLVEVTGMDRPVEEQGLLKGVEAAGDVRIERSLVGVVSGRDVSVAQAVAGPVAAQGDVKIHQGGCGPVLVGRDLSIHQGGCGPVMVRGDLSIEQGGTQAVLAAGGAKIGQGAFVGAVLSPRITVEDGARVLMASPLAFVAGAVAGALAAFVSTRRR
jgi:hypothetical protein